MLYLALIICYVLFLKLGKYLKIILVFDFIFELFHFKKVIFLHLIENFGILIWVLITISVKMPVNHFIYVNVEWLLHVRNLLCVCEKFIQILFDYKKGTAFKYIRNFLPLISKFSEQKKKCQLLNMLDQSHCLIFGSKWLRNLN